MKFLPVILLFCLQPEIICSGYNSPDSLVVRKIIIEGNYRTDKKLIFRELTFKTDETVSRDKIDYLRITSINNLTKTSLFNFVEMEVSEEGDGSLTVRLRLTERWYVWPNVYLNHTDRNFSEWWRTKDLNKLEYGVGLKINNFRGMGETLVLNYRFGNFTKIELDYRGIFLDKAERNSLSFLASWSAKKFLPYMIASDKQLFMKEDYPLIKSINLSAKYRYRKNYFNIQSVELGFTDYRISDTISSLNPYYAGLDNVRQRFFNLRYEFIRDNRDSRIYPKTGHLLTAGINKKGFHIIPGEFNAMEIYGNLYLYNKIVNRVYLASGIWFSSVFSDDYVFSGQTGLGYLQYVRGYEFYAVNGDNAFLFKSLLKYELLPVKVIKLNCWPIRRLYQFNKIPLEIYANIFFDAGYVNDRNSFYKTYNNILVNKMMYSTGIGLDFVTYYDKVFRLDYSFNALGESGLFIHWKAAFR
ncbi:MAG: BamA/TamA family outer membrane protein [Bacteroidales bacterium]|jgi:outer membrane protein assembly factor BamA|nr:BamA/TamA family outer membrane protein [Bacteroidales bacterium]